MRPWFKWRGSRLVNEQRHAAQRRGRLQPRRLVHERLECRALLAAVIADFNGDTFGDLAVGVPLEDLGGLADAGAVNVIYGTAAGLSATATVDQFWNQNSADIDDAAEAGDAFGESLATGDFNDDGFSDLAIGVPGEDIGAIVDA